MMLYVPLKSNKKNILKSEQESQRDKTGFLMNSTTDSVLTAFVYFL